MRTRSRTMERVLAWLLVGLLLIAVFAAALFHQPLLQAVGATRDGAPTTIPPALFSPCLLYTSDAADE